jgi:hypothetical protein
MKKGQETLLSILISFIVLVIILIQYLIFFVIIPDKSIELNSGQYVGSEINLKLLTFTRLNSDLIVDSVRTKDYKKIEDEITNMNLGYCWEFKINNKRFKSDNYDSTYECNIKVVQNSKIKIPDYNNKEIEINLTIK